jgi:hypothetical protein
MSNRYRSAYILMATIFLISLIAGGVYWYRNRGGDPQVRLMRAVSAFSPEQAPADKLKINDPFDETLFPPDIIAPTFRWTAPLLDVDRWGLVFNFQDGSEPMRFLTDQKEWTPAGRDGKIFAMDVDFASDKGSYFISPVENAIPAFLPERETKAERFPRKRFLDKHRPRGILEVARQ